LQDITKSNELIPIQNQVWKDIKQ